MINNTEYLLIWVIATIFSSPNSMDVVGLVIFSQFPSASNWIRTTVEHILCRYLSIRRAAQLLLTVSHFTHLWIWIQKKGNIRFELHAVLVSVFSHFIVFFFFFPPSSDKTKIIDKFIECARHVLTLVF